MRDDWRGDGRMPISFRPKSGGGGGPVLPQVASASLLLDLQADALSLNDNDPVALWPDASGNGNDFTQSGTACPVYLASYLGHPAVFLNSPNNEPQWMQGPNFADNLNSFAVFGVVSYDDANTNGTTLLSKIGNLASGFYDRGWTIGFNSFMSIIEDGNLATEIDKATSNPDNNPAVFDIFTGEVLSFSSVHLYVNGDNSHESSSGVGVVTTISNNYGVTLGIETQVGGTPFYVIGWIRAVMVYAPAPNASDRSAIEHWLATKYGITLP